MYTSAELQLLRIADPDASIPGVDTPVGNPFAQSSLKALSSLSTSAQAAIRYVPSSNTVYIMQAGTVVSGYDFGSATVMVAADNVTIENCSFEKTTGYFAIQVHNGNTNTTITNNTFDGGGVPSQLAAWVASSGSVTVTNNRFINTPGDGLHCEGGGVISGNYFSGSGFSSTGQHPDAIWVTNSTAPLSISNNFIDWTTNPNSVCSTNDCIRITSDLGNVSNVTVTGNYLIGGSACIDAGNLGRGTFSNITIANNYLGFATCFDLFPGPMTGVKASGNVIFDYSNPQFAAAGAWIAYQAAGLPTKNLLVSTNGSTLNAATLTGSTTLYGGVVAGGHLFGGAYENNFVAGFGREWFFGGAGANIFTYLNPNGSQTGAGSPTVISNFDPAKDVIDLSHIDANLSAAGTQSFAFIGTNALTSAGAQLNYVQNAATNITTIQATLAGDTKPDLVIQMAGLINLTAANFALTQAQSTADMANGGSVCVSLAARSGSAFNYAYSNVKGHAYTSYNAIEYANQVAVDDLNLSASSNQINLLENNATITRGSGTESFVIGNGTFNLAFHANETINVGASGGDTFAFRAGFGAETINGFAASGANADTLQLSTSAFSYLNSGMTQAQDLAAVLINASATPSGLTITDRVGDHLTLAGVSAATLAANPAAVRFV